MDAETSEQHAELTDGQRSWDLELASERVFGELSDLQAGDLLPPEVDPFEVIEKLQRRYARLWDELTSEEILRPEEQRYRIADRLRRLNELGFDADEVELLSTPEGTRLRVRTKVAESGQQSRELFRETGIAADENQARRLRNDIASFRGYLEQKQGHPVSETVAAHRWLEEVYDPVVVAIPDEPARPPVAARDLPRDPRAPLVPVRGGRPRRRHHRGGEVLLRQRCCPPCPSRCPRPPISTSWPWPRAAARPLGARRTVPTSCPRRPALAGRDEQRLRALAAPPGEVRQRAGRDADADRPDGRDRVQQQPLVRRVALQHDVQVHVHEQTYSAGSSPS